MFNFIKTKLFKKEKSKYPFLFSDGIATATFKYLSTTKINNLIIPKELDVTLVSSRISSFQMDDLTCYRLYESDDRFLQLNYKKNSDVLLDCLYMTFVSEQLVDSHNKLYREIGSPSIKFDGEMYARDVDDENENVIEPFKIIETFNNDEQKVSDSMIFRNDLTGTNVVNGDLLYLELTEKKLRFYKTYLIDVVNI